MVKEDPEKWHTAPKGTQYISTASQTTLVQNSSSSSSELRCSAGCGSVDCDAVIHAFMTSCESR